MESAGCKNKKKNLQNSYLGRRDRNNHYQKFIELNKNFPETILILITSGNLDTIINSVNQNRLFRIIRNPYNDAEVIKYLNEAYNHWNGLQKSKKKNTLNDKESLQRELIIARKYKNLLQRGFLKWKNLDIVCFW